MDMLVDIHTHDRTGSSGTARLLCAPPEEIGSVREDGYDRFCTGIHPRECGLPTTENRFALVAALARTGAVSAIGESGLDRSCQPAGIATQLAWFRRHIALSEEVRLPLVIHSVKTDSDILAEHARARPRASWIIHACSANVSGLDQILSKGIHVSYGPREMSRPDARARLERACGNLFFLETDDSRTPLGEVYARAAELLGTTSTEIAALTNANWRRLFGG